MPVFKLRTAATTALFLASSLLAPLTLSYAQGAAPAGAPFTLDWTQGVCKHCNSGQQLGLVRFTEAGGVWGVAFWPSAGEEFSGGSIAVHSVDAGRTWKQFSLTMTHTAPPALSFADALHGWISGLSPNGDSWIFSTADGGRHWARVSEMALQGVVFVDDQHGYGRMGNHFLRSNDGGRSWADSEVPQLSYIDRMYFLDRHNGWLAGEDGEDAIVLRTADGGLHWEEARVASGRKIDEIHDVYFGDAHNGWLVTWHSKDEGARLFYSRDGGLSWQADSGAAYQGPRNWLGGVRVAAGGVAMGFGRKDAEGSAGKGMLLYSRDRGVHWQEFDVLRAIEDCQVVGGDLMCSALGDRPGLWLLKVHPRAVADSQ
jgi:photosystem II stability/assembly factor-like uncharacterized protein